MTAQTSRSIDWSGWLERWDIQQTGYLPNREERFGAMLDVLATLLPPAFLALDLCCGPGSISQRLLNRFPQARSIAVDTDPVLLALGQGALGDQQGRLRWAKVDLTDPAWVDALASGEPESETQSETFQVDAVLSTTALHWLAGDVLARVYHQLGQIIRPGGVFLNGDHMAFGPHMPTFRKLVRSLKDAQHRESFEVRGVEDWEAWWTALADEPGAAELLAERERRLAWRDRKWTEAISEFHQAALRDAGFAEVGVIWQHLDNRVLLAIR